MGTILLLPENQEIAHDQLNYFLNKMKSVSSAPNERCSLPSRTGKFFNTDKFFKLCYANCLSLVFIFSCTKPLKKASGFLSFEVVTVIVKYISLLYS